MKPLLGITAGLFLSGSLIAAAYAAPDLATAKGKVPQGVKNAKKAMESKRERDNKARAVMKRGHESRRQSQATKAALK